MGFIVSPQLGHLPFIFLSLSWLQSAPLRIPSYEARPDRFVSRLCFMVPQATGLDNTTSQKTPSGGPTSSGSTGRG
jgi:hypothetical protein